MTEAKKDIDAARIFITGYEQAIKDMPDVVREYLKAIPKGDPRLHHNARTIDEYADWFIKTIEDAYFWRSDTLKNKSDVV